MGREDASDFDGEVIGLLLAIVRRPDVAQAGEELSRWERVILFKVVDGRHDGCWVFCLISNSLL